MSWKNILIVAAILTCGVAPAQTFEIVQGTAAVDGVLSAGEWGKANWIVMDKFYSGVPIDLTNAAWAAMWDSSANMLYVAITGTDTDHVMRPWAEWDQQDAIELYVNARNDDVTGYYYTTNDFAQQYVVGYDESATSVWARLGPIPIPSNTLPAVAFGMVTNRLVYEFKIRPYDHLYHYDVSNSTVVTLRPKMVIGLDVVMNSRTAGYTFGMLCENTMGGKFTDAGKLRDHKLVTAPAAIIFIR